jgi:hypothetical protein
VITPGGGTKLREGSGHTGRVSGEEATDFRGEESLEDGRGFGGTAAEAVRANVKQARPAERLVQAAEGETFEGRSPRALRPEIGSRGFGRNKASRGWETLKTHRSRDWYPRRK